MFYIDTLIGISRQKSEISQVRQTVACYPQSMNYFVLGLVFITSQIAEAQMFPHADLFSDLRPGECRIGELVQVQNLPPARDQKALGYCYGFAAAAALDVMICQARDNFECSKGADAISSLDVIRTGNDSKLVEGGFPMGSFRRF